MATTNRIRDLQTAAGQAGDLLQAAICQIALDGEVRERTYASLSSDERARIDGMSQDAARTECGRVLGRGAAERIGVGDRVEGGDGEDYDAGSVISIDADNDAATVAWDSGVSTPADLSSLRVIE